MRRILAAIGFVVASGSAHAEASDVDVFVHIVNPLAASVSNMNFGDVVAGSAGTVTLSADGTRTASGVVLGNATDASPGRLTLAGAPSASFSVDLTDSVKLTKSNDSAKFVTVSNLTYAIDVNSPGEGSEASYGGSPVTGTLNSSGSAIFRIGGKLTIPADTPAGDYATNHTGGEPLVATVSYN